MSTTRINCEDLCVKGSRNNNNRIIVCQQHTSSIPVQMSEIEMMKPYVWLRTSDDSIQQVEQEIAMICPFICQEISQKGTGSSKSSPICLPQKVSLAMMNLILDYCRFHHVQGHTNKERKLYDEDFVRILADSLCELVYAAYNLQLQPLIDLTCREIAQVIQRSSPEEIRAIFHRLGDLFEKEKSESFINITCNSSSRLSNRLKKNKLKERERIQKYVEVEKEEERVADERPIEELVSFINGSNDGEPTGIKICKNKKKNRRRKKEKQKNSFSKAEDGHMVEFDDENDQALTAKIDMEVEKKNSLEVEFDGEIVQSYMTKFGCEVKEEVGHVVEFDDEIGQALMAKIDSKVVEDDLVVKFEDEIDHALLKKIDKEVEEEDDHVVESDDDNVDTDDDEIHKALMAEIDREVEEFNRILHCPWAERKKEFFRDVGNHK